MLDANHNQIFAVFTFPYHIDSKSKLIVCKASTIKWENDKIESYSKCIHWL